MVVFAIGAGSGGCDAGPWAGLALFSTGSREDGLGRADGLGSMSCKCEVRSCCRRLLMLPALQISSSQRRQGIEWHGMLI